MEIKSGKMEYQEAIQLLDGKIDLTPEEFRKLNEYYRRYAFTVSGYSEISIINKIKEALIQAIDEGQSMSEFKEQINSYLEDHGYKGMNNYQIDNVFRTNVQTAYQVGHYKQMTKPSVMHLRPYWMYDAVNDSRTRPAHLAMNGRVYPADHPVWDTWYPPNGYRCRCTVRTLSKRQVEQMGLTVETEEPYYGFTPDGQMIPVRPDPRFDYNPAKLEFEPDLELFPKELREAYERRNAK